MFSTSKFFRNPPSTTPTDPYFNYTTLLLNDTGTNGAQNNTFLDSSTNNFSITRSGNTTQGSVNPYQPTGSWSGYFDGNGDYLQAPSSTAFNFGTSDFTIEGWVFPEWFSSSGTSSKDSVFVFGTGANADGGGAVRYDFGMNYQGYLRFNNCPEGGANLFTTVATSNPLTLNNWNHVAVVRNGTSVLLFVNGVQCSTTGGTISSSITVNRASVLRIGRLLTTTTYDFQSKGYLSNFRIVSGTAVYTSGFTPSTTALTAISGTSLLCLQNNRFIDNSSNNFTITRTGDVAVTGFNPFAPTASYTTSAYGGSAYFDGSGTTANLPFIKTPASSSLALAGSTGTFECWVYPTAYNTGGLPNGAATIVSWNTGNPYYNAIGISSTGYLYISKDGGGAIGVTSTTIIPLNTWTHIAWTYNGTTNLFFVNGVDITSQFASNPTLSGTFPLSGSPYMMLGAVNYSFGSWTYLYPFIGYISNARLVKGTTIYTSTFTPPVVPVTNVSNTSLLLNATNAGIYNATALSNMQTVGNAQVSTAQAKWGAGSVFFDGSGDYLYLPKSSPLDMGSGNFTLEWWMYPTTTSQLATASIIASGNATWSTGAVVVDCGSNASNKVRFVTYPNGVAVGDSNAWTVNTWTHFACVRNGNTLTLYRNGTSVASNPSMNTWQNTINFNFNNATKIGGGHWDGATSYFTGYIEDLRITKGVARYTSNFTAPTAPFPTR